MKAINIQQGDCLQLLKGLPDNSIDAVITDPPYGSSACKWDSVIPFEPMWTHLKRIVKPNGAIVLMASQPFTSALVMSNLKMFKYCWVWEKSQGANPFQAKTRPMKVHEDVVVFFKKASVYNPQMTKGKGYSGHTGGANLGEAIGGGKSVHRHNPEGMLYPRSVQKIASRKTSHADKLHPTIKPVALMEYLIKTYTNEGETVLDFTMGSGTTGVACVNTKRKFVGFELDETYFQTSGERILKAQLGDLY